MALPRPQEERWRYDSAAVALLLLLLHTLVPCCPPRHVPWTPLCLCLGRDTPPWTAQHKKILPRPRHSKEWPADSLGAGGGGWLANGTVPGVD